jgi:hypothetical protein
MIRILDDTPKASADGGQYWLCGQVWLSDEHSDVKQAVAVEI